MRLIKYQKVHFSALSAAKPAKNSSFTPLETLDSSDLSLSISRLIHKKSGAMIYDIRSNDKDRTFSPIVRTLPENDTGCPHILEHLACCGSERYPIRDPFFNMLRRSVNTYMNAWTGDDFTAYPFSSANKKDFDNLYRVYLDMCLKPLLNELDFRQQGWRYEINQQTGLKQIKGIVFNQMKGAYQNPDRQLYVEIANKLFCDTPFGFDSGGKPDSIVNLSYQQVKNMHSYYYHPSNMSFYYYGDTDINQNLSYLEREYLLSPSYLNTTQTYIQKSSALFQKLPSNPQRYHKIQSHTAQTPNIALTYNLGLLAHAPPVDVTCLNILSYLLLETNQAILYQEFIQAHLADSFGVSGFNIGSVLTFNVSLKNVNIKQSQFIQKVEKSLQDMIQKGVDEKRVQQYVRQTELDILTPKKNQGIKHLGTCMPYMVNRLPLNNLAYVRSYLSSAVKKLKNKAQLTQMINKYFLKNEKKVVILQQPLSQQNTDPYMNIKGLQMGQQIIRKQQNQLKIRQQSVSSNSVQCLPKLSINDLEATTQKQFKIHIMGKSRQGNLMKEIYVGVEIPQINFLKVVFRLDMGESQNNRLLPFLDIWKYSINQGISTKTLTNKELSSKLNLNCHNFHVQFEKPRQSQPTVINIVFTASCLEKNIPQYIKLLKQIIFEPVFTKENMDNIFRSYKMQKTQQLLDANVMQYCLDYGSALLSQQAQIWDGYQWVVNGIKIATNSKEVPKQFQQIHQRLRSFADITYIQHSQKFIEGIPQKLGFQYSANEVRKILKKSEQHTKKSQQVQQKAVTNSYNVNFCSQQYMGPKFYSKQHAQITLFIQILEQDYLHQKIREKGGAYGARATYRDVGTIALYSYMDPYSEQTFQAFQDSIGQLLAAQISQARLEQVKIKTIGNIELPIVPQNQGIARIFKGYSVEERNKFISSIREANWQDIIKTSKKYLVGTKKSKIMFGKDVPKGFKEQQLQIPKQEESDEQVKADQNK